MGKQIYSLSILQDEVFQKRVKLPVELQEKAPFRHVYVVGWLAGPGCIDRRFPLSLNP